MINQKLWIKAHKKDFANSLISESGAIPDGHPTAIFMAGLPGAGKTEFTKNLMSILEHKIVRLDMDEIATKIKGYKPEIADLFRSGASELLNKTYDIVLKNQLDFIMDGTFSSKYAKNNINRAIKHGYSVKVIYVLQDPKLAWFFTKEREKIEHRAINQEGFIDTYFKTIENIKDIFLSNNDIILDIIKKDSYNKIKEWISNIQYEEIDKYINNCYTNKTLKEYLDGRRNQAPLNAK